MKKPKPELLSPAGDLDKAKIAFQYGADAVYVGLKEFGMRQKEIKMNRDELSEIIQYAHSIDKKVYVTVNVFAKNDDYKKLDNYLKFLKKAKPDALIVADPGVLCRIKKLAPEMSVHLSTQANVTNYESALWWIGQGVDRIVLARELTSKEIGQIVKKIGQEKVEIFVHGALCMSYSGRCNISNYLNFRDANKGDCTHCCRWDYKIYLEEPNRPNQQFPVEEDERGSYFFFSRDLALYDLMDEIYKSGAGSLKIEGRNKTEFYVAVVTSLYRMAIDLYWNSAKTYSQKKSEMKQLASIINTRGYTHGFFGGDQSEIAYYDVREGERSYEYSAKVIAVESDKVVWQAKNQTIAGQKYFVLTGDGLKEIKDLQIFDMKNGEKLDKIDTNKLFFTKNCDNLNMNNMLIRRYI